MERLTYFDHRHYRLIIDGVEYADFPFVDRLAAYEDTGLEPEEIMERIAPPNPPLTLEDLREMDGGPVWVESVEGKFVPLWLLVNVNEEEAHSAYYEFCEFADYGKTWLAYRFKTEKVQT